MIHHAENKYLHHYQVIIIPGQQQQQVRHAPVYQQPMAHHQMVAQQNHMARQQQAMMQQQQMQMQQQQMRQQQQMQMQQQQMQMQFNRWAQPNYNYQTMPGFQRVDYSGGWNPNLHDQMLKTNINQVFMKHDTNRNGQLDPHEFYPAYHDLCLMMGMAPPRTQQDVQSAYMQFDVNKDGMISPM